MSYIISELDEIEKEEFFRLKKVLKVKDKKRLEEEAEEKAAMEAMLEVRVDCRRHCYCHGRCCRDGVADVVTCNQMV